MTFLPIVERELRVATRRRSTYWLRATAAGVALIIGSGMLLLTLVPFGGQIQSGAAMFGTLTWISLAAALSAGLFFTSDCLSEEKREGTLGFLFLTDLRGYDVVLGKLLATSLRSVSPLLAVFPVLATTLLLGGVEMTHFWQTVLAVGNAAFFSLAVGLFASVVSRHSLKALAATLILLVLFVGVGPLLDNAVSSRARPAVVLSLASPGYAFVAAEYSARFWPALAVSHLVAWLLLGLACALVRRTWQEKPSQSIAIKLRFLRPTQPVRSKRSHDLRARLLEKNPVTWLVARERGQAVVLWAIVAVMLASFMISILTDLPGLMRGWSFVNGCLSLVLYLWVTARACQLFAEARRNGTIELLLSTPLTSRDTVQGAWQGLVRLFALPVLLLVGFQLVASVLVGDMTRGFATTGEEFAWIGTVAMVVSALVKPMNLIALAWFGLWMGLTSKGSLSATLKTIVFVQIIPLFVIYFITGIAMPLLLMVGALSTGGGTPSQQLVNFWMPLLFTGLPSVLAVLKDIFLWSLARRKLSGNFRQLAVRSLVPIHGPSVPPIIRAAP